MSLQECCCCSDCPPIFHNSILTLHSCRHTLRPRNCRDMCPTRRSRKIRLFSFVYDPYSRKSNCSSRLIRLNTTTVMASAFLPRLFKKLYYRAYWLDLSRGLGRNHFAKKTDTQAQPASAFGSKLKLKYWRAIPIPIPFISA